ncbi:hypothetical protein Bca101_099384 [Brassica carinata]
MTESSVVEFGSRGLEKTVARSRICLFTTGKLGFAAESLSDFMSTLRPSPLFTILETYLLYPKLRKPFRSVEIVIVALTLKIWVKSRTRKDGTPINTNTSEKIQKAAELVNGANPSYAKDRDEDTLNKTTSEMQEKQIELQETVDQLKVELAKSVNKKSLKRCFIIDWADEDGNIGEGRIISSDPYDIVNDSLLSPTDVEVLVDSATEPEAYLSRSTRNMAPLRKMLAILLHGLRINVLN